MPAESNAHHVIDLSLMPISRAPYADNRGSLPFLFANIGLQTQVPQMAVAIKVINQCIARVIAVVIDARDVYQVIKPKFLFGEPAHFRNPLNVRDLQTDFPAKL